MHSRIHLYTRRRTITQTQKVTSGKKHSSTNIRTHTHALANLAFLSMPSCFVEWVSLHALASQKQVIEPGLQIGESALQQGVRLEHRHAGRQVVQRHQLHRQGHTEPTVDLSGLRREGLQHGQEAANILRHVRGIDGGVVFNVQANVRPHLLLDVVHHLFQLLLERVHFAAVGCLSFAHLHGDGHLGEAEMRCQVLLQRLLLPLALDLQPQRGQQLSSVGYTSDVVGAQRGGAQQVPVLDGVGGTMQRFCESLIQRLDQNFQVVLSRLNVLQIVSRGTDVQNTGLHS